jgi:hypothetical protein
MFADLIRDALLGDVFALSVIFVATLPFVIVGSWLYTVFKERK